MDKGRIQVVFIETPRKIITGFILQLSRLGYIPEFKKVKYFDSLATVYDKPLDLVFVYDRAVGVGLDGVVESIKNQKLEASIVVITNDTTPSRMVNLMRKGANEILHPDRLGDLGSALETFIGDARTRHKQHKAYAENLKLSEAVRKSGNVLFITDCNGIIEYVNPSFSTVTGYSIEEAVGKTAKLIETDENNTSSIYQEQITVRLTGDIWRGDVLNRKKNGRKYWAIVSISPIKNDEGEVTHLINVCEDISAHKRNQEQLESLAFYDPVTQLANRHLFKDRFNCALTQTHPKRNRKRGQYKVALLCLDLDKFKVINDTYGHLGGDSLLQSISKRIQRVVRETDTVARLGGDEFAVILPDLEGDYRQAAITAAKKILDSISETIYVLGNQVTVTSSIGIAFAPEHGDDQDDLFHKADVALYEAKHSGRCTYRVYETGMGDVKSEQKSIVSEMERAVKNKELSLSIQPEFLFTNEVREIVGYETFLLWDHPERGRLNAGSFITDIENDEVMIDVGKWVIDESLSISQSLNKDSKNDLTISINLSANEFRSQIISEHLKQKSRELNIAPESIELEVSESTLMGNYSQSMQTIEEMKGHGFKYSIDHFGSSSTPLKFLHSLPVDRIRMDRELLKDGLDNEEVVSGIIALCHKLNKKVLADGIQTEEQLGYLRANNCDFYQGFYLDKPSVYSKGNTGYSSV